MKRANPPGPGRRCAFCNQIGGTGFPLVVLEALGGRPGARHAHADCLSKAQKKAK